MQKILQKYYNILKNAMNNNTKYYNNTTNNTKYYNNTRRY